MSECWEELQQLKWLKAVLKDGMNRGQLWGDEGVVGLGCDFVDELGKQLQLAAAFPCLSQSIQC